MLLRETGIEENLRGHEAAPRFATLDEWLRWQEGLHFTAIDLGLDRCRQVAEQLRLFSAVPFLVSIAGTNGKGSSAHMLENILRTAGYNVGLYTSPHLVCYNERIRVNGRNADDRVICESFNRVDHARGNVSLTYFEFGTLAAIDIFCNSGVDIAVMEVGLGGRLDAVNILDANVSMITTIDMDHEQWLGNDRDAIGREKSGIFRSGSPAICADPDPPAGLLESADKTGADLLISGLHYWWKIHGDTWSWSTNNIHFNRLPVPGGQVCQVQNAAGVLMVLHSIAGDFPVDQATISRSLLDFRIPGRFQYVPGDVPLILDVAHNHQSAKMLAANLDSSAGAGRTLLVLGMLDDKDHFSFIKELSLCVDHWYLTALNSDRGQDSVILSEIVKSINPSACVYRFDEPDHALTAAVAGAQPGDRIVVTGSFLTVGAAIKYLGIDN